jgi:5'-deoxynucleotidase YfbR-like HD superfamily hydrolase
MDYIDTFSGKRIYPFNPEISEINIEDIAHALSLLCRFGGHCSEFYSIAQHSVYVSQVCDKENALWGLLHDATEAYIGDVVKPIKRQDEMKKYREAEEKLEKVIAQKFNLTLPLPQDIKIADKRMLIAEKRDLMKNCELKDWEYDDIKAVEFKVEPIGPKDAERLFLSRYGELI